MLISPGIPAWPAKLPQVAGGGNDDLARPLSVDGESKLFWRVRARQLWNALCRSAEASRLRLALITGLTALLWGMLFALFVDGFKFLNLSISDTPTHDETVRALYSLLFASLLALLAFSTAIILYGALYCSAEVRFLLTTPTREERIFVHKFQEAMFMSSWVFLLLASPMLVAYGLVEGAGWFYYLVIVPFLLAFVFVPGSWGAWCCLMVVRWLPANRGQFLMFAAVTGTCLGLLAMWFFASDLGTDLLTPNWFKELLARLKLSEYRLLPSWWLSSGLLEAVHAHWRDDAGRRALTESLMFLALVISNALFFHLLAVWTARRNFRLGYLALEGERAARRPRRLAWLDRALLSGGLPFAPQMRELLVKDFRLLRRDPAQWSQLLVFAALLVLYFINARKLTYNVDYAGWINMISFMNLAVIGLLLSTFTTRFVYPMISLEGRRFWILGLLPLRRETILWSKYLFAALGSFPPCLMLVLLSDLLLAVSDLVLIIHVLGCALLCSGLSGIAVGLGASMPNLRHDSPARIAAGFGGTLTLVVSTGYILAIVFLVALPCHFYLAMAETPLARSYLQPERFHIWLTVGTSSAVVVCLIATIAPLWFGLRVLRKLEF